MMIRQNRVGQNRFAVVRIVQRRLLAFIGLFCLMTVTSAHIGSPDVWIEGNAGPYPVVVNVQVPGVVPGIANVYVRVTGDGVQQVLAFGTTFDATGGAPPPEAAKPVDGMPGMYLLPLWMMTPGSSSVTVIVRGTRGEGKIVVPVVIEAHQRLTLDVPLGITLGVVGIILFVGAISVVGAAARESVLTPGITPDPRRKRIARYSMGGAVIVFCALLFGGWTWWNVEDAKFVKTLFKPMDTQSVVRMHGTHVFLDISITDPEWKFRNSRQRFSRRTSKNATLSPLVEDHGKLMHAFVISESDMNALAHIHPTTKDSVTFSTVLPPLPAGRYRVLADIVRESGYSETLTSTLIVSESEASVARAQTGSVQLDADDAWYVGNAARTDTITLAPNVRLHWNRDGATMTEKVPAPLNFSITDTLGTPVMLEPYMGMAAHAMVMRDDASVFIHLHPTGTVSMAAQETFVVRRPTDTVKGMVARRMQTTGDHSVHRQGSGSGAMMPETSMPLGMGTPVEGKNVRFPYAFPKSGNYRVWVQVKVDGKILTGSFLTSVNPADGTAAQPSE